MRHLLRKDPACAKEANYYGGGSLVGGQRVPLGASALRGRTALHFAAINGHGSVAELLLQHKADIEAKDNWGPGARGGRARPRHEGRWHWSGIGMESFETVCGREIRDSLPSECPKCWCKQDETFRIG